MTFQGHEKGLTQTQSCPPFRRELEKQDVIPTCVPVPLPGPAPWARKAGDPCIPRGCCAFRFASRAQGDGGWQGEVSGQGLAPRDCSKSEPSRLRRCAQRCGSAPSLLWAHSHALSLPFPSLSSYNEFQDANPLVLARILPRHAGFAEYLWLYFANQGVEHKEIKPLAFFAAGPPNPGGLRHRYSHRPTPALALRSSAWLSGGSVTPFLLGPCAPHHHIHSHFQQLWIQMPEQLLPGSCGAGV